MEEDGDCSVPSIFECLYSLLQPHPSLKNQFLAVSHWTAEDDDGRLWLL